ncbi:SdpI family protein [Desulfotomaculum sp. 1211_IL3151]|uniref:SdpI family protein n=1 Tax=Desulfotomaculum sp. 1211_IL3151 TaxID=3084055 RepID=UPI002FDB7875
METKRSVNFSWLTIIILLAYWAVCASFYPALPEQVPTHWNIRGEVDGYSHKSVAALIMPLLPLGIYLFMTFLPKIDPKKQNYRKFAPSYEKMRLATVGVIMVVSALPILSALGYHLNVEFIIKGAVSLLIIVMGNYMGKIKYNYLVGFRLPWTLANEDVWNQTHRFGGKLMVIGGCVSLLSVFLSGTLGFVIFMLGIFLPMVLTMVYSYLAFAKFRKEQ